ncbi:MAG: carotenoid biosynthesis protein [Bacteroidota bacterium]
MERSKRTRIAVIIFLVIWHQVGVIGLHLEETRLLFQQLVPLNLLLSTACLTFFHRKWNFTFGVFCLAVFWMGYLIEVLGVRTGLIFGNYAYGNSLGPKVSSVPPMIGLNWLMLTYMGGVIANSVLKHPLLGPAIGATLMVLMDIMIEPMAIRYDFWIWDGGSIPLQNYIAWWVISYVFVYGFYALKMNIRNQIAGPLYVIQFLFFAIFLLIENA